MSTERWVYDFADGSREMRDLLGGKGANVAEMTRLLGPGLVPPGFTITTRACVAYMETGAFPDGLEEQIAAALGRLEQRAGRALGDPRDPLLVSVRSGARESMPGMMDTVLNLGLNDESVAGLAARTGNDRFAWDSYRRLVQMYGNVVLGIEGRRFEDLIQAEKDALGVRDDVELDAAALRRLTAAFKALYEFPTEPATQLRAAVAAVFRSWMGDRAVTYRRLNRIPDDWGTAVNVQQMVYGNKGEDSGSGVAFSRDEVTGGPTPSGDFLPNAQGEDVVSGVRTPRDISELAEWLPEVNDRLMEILKKLERHYGDMQDTEFTVEEGRLYMLQTRSAKRPAQAAVRFAVDAVDEGLLEPEQALMTIDASTLDTLLHPTFDPAADYEILAEGVAASPGAAKGEVVFDAPSAIDAAAEGRDVILVRSFTEADDVGGFHAARGILTSEGGKASHAALVARGMGVPAVTGAGALQIDEKAGEVRIDGRVALRAGDRIAIDGSAGAVTADDVPLVEGEMSDSFRTVLGWADRARRLGVRTNADTAEDARRAHAFGAEGIGLCRTEHMFFGEKRHEAMVAVILADDDEARLAGLSRLLPLQQGDFEKLFAEMDGLPVTIRLLDPPLHEFLPPLHELERRVEHARSEGSPDADALEHQLTRVRALQEVNPMLGTRGVRLGLLFPAIYAMQVEAVFRALAAARSEGVDVHAEIMVPLVDYRRELELLREQIERIAAETGMRRGVDYAIGTMIELPRACLRADEIALEADFCSFGTNDLTQTALGFSRDDIEGPMLSSYIGMGVFDRSPFETLDTPGVGQLVRIGAWLARTTKGEIKLGVCGEHGGDPDSIEFFDASGIDYVSCSPYRVPVARVAAAQAALRHAAE
ncbi:MAG: pyruvate, phosphate dikinase [Syntrophothermus sp.]